jgi:SAM-dependent methyltransferase
VYSREWFETFLHSVREEQSDAEAAFLMRCLPIERFPRILDVCCGAGRHAVRLARAGYDVTGVDGDEDVLRRAACLDPDAPRYVLADVRRLESLGLGRFDGALIMWQSFGQFDGSENDRLLSAISGILGSRGRLVLDLYHRQFFESHQGVRTLQRAGRYVAETKTMEGTRLSVHLAYEDGGSDEFDWELFTPDELSERAGESGGLRLLEACAKFDERVPASPELPRFQAVFERV